MDTDVRYHICCALQERGKARRHKRQAKCGILGVIVIRKEGRVLYKWHYISLLSFLARMTNCRFLSAPQGWHCNQHSDLRCLNVRSSLRAYHSVHTACRPLLPPCRISQVRPVNVITLALCPVLALFPSGCAWCFCGRVLEGPVETGLIRNW